MAWAATMRMDDTGLGTLLAKGLASGEPAAACPGLETIAGLVDGTVTGAERDRLLGHLALCDDCRELFVASSQLAGEPQAAERRKSYLVPAAFAAAAVLAVTLTLQFAPLSTDKKMVARQAPLPAQGTARQGETRATAPATGGREVATGRGATGRARAKVAGAVKGAAPGGSELARLLVRSGDAGRLATLAGASDKTFGFAAKGDDSSLAFRVGANLMNLQLALLAEDGDRAQAQVTRLTPLLETLAGSSDLTRLERISERLDQGESPRSLIRKSGELEQLVPKEQLSYARLGAWAQGARLAAKTGNREYLAAGVPRYFGNRLTDDTVSLPAAAALRQLDLKLKRPGSIDFETVEKDVARLLGQF